MLRKGKRSGRTRTPRPVFCHRPGRTAFWAVYSLWCNGLPKCLCKWFWKTYFHGYELEQLRRDRWECKMRFVAYQGEKYFFLLRCIVFEQRFLRFNPATGVGIKHVREDTMAHHDQLHIEPGYHGFHPIDHAQNIFGTLCIHSGHWQRDQEVTVEQRLQQAREEPRRARLAFDYEVL